MLKYINKALHILEHGKDNRTKNWFLIPPIPFFSSLVLYLLLVKVFLPKFMEKRKPFGLKNVLIAYNSFQVVLSVYLFYLPAFALYQYLISKYTEFLDTFFFVLRKKDNQISFLHVYHHVTTPIFIWFAISYYPGGSYIFLMLCNTFIHIIMYTYYLLAAFGPEMQKYLWWKKYITVLQLVQFVVCLIHFGIVITSTECNISSMATFAVIINSMVLCLLFSNFYNRSYKKNRRLEENVKMSNRNKLLVDIQKLQ